MRPRGRQQQQHSAQSRGSGRRVIDSSPSLFVRAYTKEGLRNQPGIAILRGVFGLSRGGVKFGPPSGLTRTPGRTRLRSPVGSWGLTGSEVVLPLRGEPA